MGSVLERLEDLIRNSEEITSKFTDFKNNDFPSEVEAEKTKAVTEFREAIRGLYAARGSNAPYAWQDRLIAKVEWSDHEQNFILCENQRGTVVGDLMILMGSEFTDDNEPVVPDHFAEAEAAPVSSIPVQETLRESSRPVHEAIDIPDYDSQPNEEEIEGVGLPDPAYLIPGSR